MRVAFYIISCRIRDAVATQIWLFSLTPGYDGYTAAARGFNVVVLPSSNNRVPSCFLRIASVKRKMPDGADDHTKKGRWLHDLKRCHHDGLTQGKMDSRCQHENEPSLSLPAIF